MTIDPDLKDTLNQIAWANFEREDCGPANRVRTPTREQVTAGYAKLRGVLTWGCKLEVYWQQDVEFWRDEEKREGWKEWCEPDRGYLIALPGYQDELHDGVAWFPAIREEKDNGQPLWMVLSVLLANPMVAWVEVVK